MNESITYYCAAKAGNSMKKLSLSIIVFLLLLPVVVLASGFSDVPGSIPIGFKRPPATDLKYHGKILLPHEAVKLHESGIDLSDISPEESDIWKNQENVPELPDELDEMEVQNNDSVKYLSKIISRSGNFRFSAFKEMAGGEKAFTFMLSKKIHNILLRAAVLRKLGYVVPPVKHLPKLKLSFDSKFEKENFVNRMAEDTFGDPARWIIQNSEDGKEIILQDLIVMNADDLIYNLALGFVPASIIRGRRAMNSLLIPFSLTDIPESVNLFPWHGGTVISGHVKVDYEAAFEFSTPYEDARWILKRLKKLKRKDFFEIADRGRFPHEVRTLVAHKLIARRNSLLRFFDIEAEEIDFDPKVTEGEFLVDGKLKKETWEGHASRYAYGDPESPLSSSEIFAYFKSKTISNIISNLVHAFNTKIIPQTDIQQELIQRQMNRAVSAYRNALLNGGPLQPEPVSVFAIPTFGANFIASREIIAGSYLGTDNVVQLADSIGASFSIGAFLGTDLVQAPWVVSGGVNGHLTRTYSHIRPIKSMKKALKTSFRNILIPLHKRKIGKMLDRVIDENLENAEIDDEQRQKRLTEILNVFKENLEIGESLMITDTIGAGFSARGGYQFTSLLKAYVGFRAKQIVLSRLHILRKNEDTVHVYKDLGGVSSVGINFGVNAFIPVVKISAEADGGKSKTKFHVLSINDNIKINPDIFKTVGALRTLLVKNSLEQVKAIAKPYFLKHSFQENKGGFSLLIFKAKGLKARDFVTVQHPEGAKKYFYRRVQGHREGIDFQTTFLDVVNALIKELTDQDDINLSSSGSGNPADTFYGKAYSRSVVFEGEVVDPESESYRTNGTMRRSFVSVVHRWKGWKISHKKAKKILKKMNKKYGPHFYPDTVLNETQKLELYQIKLNLYFYENAVRTMAELSRASVKKLFRKHGVFTENNSSCCSETGREPEEILGDTVRSFRWYQKKYKKALLKNKLSKISAYASKMVSLVESTMNVDGIMKMAGGSKNVYIYSRMEGFRTGDENGDRPFVSNSVGEIGSQRFKGPLFDMQEKIGMTEAEFFGYWIQDRL
ncbi:MAG: hypothetical protein KAQ98_07265 [Bacteriovoracaceae bacterium]|nr:hypothetical protein [Bacteriovoracaceae bacterium]